MRTHCPMLKSVPIRGFFSKGSRVILTGIFGFAFIADLRIGRQATANVKESLEWGTRIVGGVKPGVESEHLGLPVFPSVKVVCMSDSMDLYDDRLIHTRSPSRPKKKQSPMLLPSMFREIKLPEPSKRPLRPRSLWWSLSPSMFQFMIFCG